MKIGDLGVPMFFVVSGYCIAVAARSAIRNDLPWTHFLFRRLKRIYPPYWLSILVVVSIPFAIELISSLKTGAYQAPSPGNLNYGFLNYGLTDWLLVATLTKALQVMPEASNLSYKFTTINAVYWTLAIEVQFYLVVTAALFAARKHFYAAMLGITAVSFAASWITGIETSGLFFPYWSMFAWGILLCWLLERKITIEWIAGRFHLVTAGMVCAVMLAIFLVFAASGEGINHSIFAGLFCLFLFLLYGIDQIYAAKIEKSKVKWIQWLVAGITAIGAMSYSLYLLHGRLQFLVMQFVRQAVSADTIAFDIAVIAITSTACYAFYWLCERPFIGSARKKKADDAPKGAMIAT
ncbi:MAG: acyltransferase [Pirellulaceae bacterium]|nr:acyltransferase [Pirellulaceae bacterium]